MLPRADLTTNRPPGAVEAPTPATSSTDARQELFRRLNQIAIGKELTATVRAKLDDGAYLVKLAGTTARMALPVGTKVGDQLSMVFIAREPRPTFLLGGPAGGAGASLSAAARLIDHLLQSGGRDSGSGAVQGKQPLLPAAAAAGDTRQLAVGLRNAVSSSGLFYESHLRDWISGSRPLADLVREPQAQLGTALQRLAQGMQQNLSGHELARMAAGMRELGDGAQTLMRLIQDAHRQPGTRLAVDAELIARPQTTLPVLDPELARLINLQLNTLEQQQIRWQGQLWPGQNLDWEIVEERPEHEADDSENADEPPWNSSVRFELPHLGKISASLRLVGDRVHVQVHTESDESAQSLRAHGELLSEALEAAGAPLDSLLVKRGDSDAAS